MARGALKRLALASGLSSRGLISSSNLVQTGRFVVGDRRDGLPGCSPPDSNAFGPNGASPLVRSSKSIT